jgi:hypothetical protein
MSKSIRQPGPMPPQPNQSEHVQHAEAARRRREAAALRENLAKRKAQQRSRRPPMPSNGPMAEKAGGGAESQE